MIRILFNALIVRDKKTGYASVIKEYLYALYDKIETDPSSNIELLVFCQQQSLSIIDPDKKIQSSQKIKIVSTTNFSNLLLRVMYEQIILNFFALKYKCHIIHSPATLGFVFPIKPQLIFFHASTTFELPRKMHGRGKLATLLTNFIIKYSILNSKYITVTTDTTAKELLKYLKKNVNYEVIGNGIPAYHKYNPNKIRKEISNFRDKEFLFYLSSFYQLKNQSLLIEAAKKMPEKYFIIAGNPIQSDYYQQCLSEASNLENIIIVTSINDDEVDFLYRYCQLYICPSFFEGFALTPLEALSYNKPILLANTKVLNEVYGNGFLYFNPNDCNELIDLINFSTGNKDYKSFCNKNKLLRKYTWKKFSEKNLTAYKKIYAISS